MVFLLPDGWRGEVVDVSLAGLRIRTIAVIPIRTTLEGALVLNDGRKLTLKGRVAWVNKLHAGNGVQNELGLELTEVPEAYRQALAEIFAVR